MWDLWWIKWHGDRFFSEYFGFSLSISFNRCSIEMEKQKKNLIIFLIGLHNKPSRLRYVRSICCGALQQKNNVLEKTMFRTN
jgi:hypothetical protein